MNLRNALQAAKERLVVERPKEGTLLRKKTSFHQKERLDKSFLEFLMKDCSKEHVIEWHEKLQDVTGSTVRWDIASKYMLNSSRTAKQDPEAVVVCQDGWADLHAWSTSAVAWGSST